MGCHGGRTTTPRSWATSCVAGPPARRGHAPVAPPSPAFSGPLRCALPRSARAVSRPSAPPAPCPRRRGHRAQGPPGPSPCCPTAWPLAGAHRLRHRQRTAGAEPARLPALPGPPRGRSRLRCASLRRLRGPTRPVAVRHRPANRCRPRARHRPPRQAVLGPLASPGPQVPAPSRRGVDRDSDPACLLGPGLFPAATRAGESASDRRAGAGLSMAPPPVSGWARAHPVR
jgi:hypothetical protein